MRFYSFLYTSFVLTNSYILISLLRRKIKGLLKGQGDAASGILMPAERQIFAPHGSCIIFHRNYFKRGGSLQHVAFLFAEELFIAEEARRIGLRVVYAPTIRIDDLEHASTGRFLSRKMIRYRKQSIDAIIGKFYQ
jgi:GT2 family glycosyltransferase